MLKFSCMRCDGCCRFSKQAEYPVLLPHEALHLRVLAKRMGVGVALEPLDGGLVRWVVGDVCPFYDASNRSCLIHEEKPFSCRMFPLVVDIAGMRLLVSLYCSWVRAHISELENLDPREVFPNEVEALGEMLGVVFSGFEEALFVILPEDEGEAVDLESAGCVVLSSVRTRAIEGARAILAAGCNEADLLRALGSVGAKPSLIERVPIPRPAVPQG